VVAGIVDLNFGGPSGFPQAASTPRAFFPTRSHGRGEKHTIKTEGEFRRFISNSYSQTAGILTFSLTTNFTKRTASSFSVMPTQVNSRVFEDSAAGLISDNHNLIPVFRVNLISRLSGTVRRRKAAAACDFEYLPVDERTNTFKSPQETGV
jgi:hypothetical protein